MEELDRYITEMPEGRRGKAVLFHGLIKALYPEVIVGFDYKMPTYRVGDQFIAWGNKKSYLSVYACSSARITGFKKKHPDIPSGVGCINFRDRDDFPLADLKMVVVNALSPSPEILKRERRAGGSAKPAQKRR